MIKCIETSAGVIFTNHIVRIVKYVDGCHIYTVDGKCISVNESLENIMFQTYNNRLPQEGELTDNV